MIQPNHFQFTCFVYWTVSCTSWKHGRSLFSFLIPSPRQWFWCWRRRSVCLWWRNRLVIRTHIACQVPEGKRGFPDSSGKFLPWQPHPIPTIAIPHPRTASDTFLCVPWYTTPHRCIPQRWTCFFISSTRLCSPQGQEHRSICGTSREHSVFKWMNTGQS